MTPEMIEARKQFGRILSRSRRAAKLDRCLWCGKQIIRFCDSHTIPQLVLRNLAPDGMLDYANTILENPLMKLDQGIAEANIFHLLCKECDSVLFQEYENLENLKRPPTGQMLAQIALKDLFLIMSKRLLEIELYDQVKDRMHPIYVKRKQEVNSLDKRNFFEEFDHIKEMLEFEKYDFELITWDKVGYKVPVAFQDPVTVYGDMNGDLIVDIYDHSPEKKKKQMHMCVLPLDDCTVIFTFYNKTDTEYDQFAEQLRSMDQVTRLKFLGYFMFFISEDMMLAKKFPHRTYFYEQVRKMFLDQYDFWTSTNEEFELGKYRNLKKFKHWKEDMFPAILTDRYAIMEEKP